MKQDVLLNKSVRDKRTVLLPVRENEQAVAYENSPTLTIEDKPVIENARLAELSQFLPSPAQSASARKEPLLRALDIVASIFLFVVTLPLFALAALLIKLSSPGSVVFKQQRVGKNGSIFSLFKFRTMIDDAEKSTGPVWAAKDDDRITKIGRFLRKTRIDELPQLFNVLKGDMSLVGPRPERPFFVKQHPALQGVRLSVKPGLTGLAQIRGYYDLKPEHKIRYDYLYIQKRSILLNIYLLIQTIPVIFLNRGW